MKNTEIMKIVYFILLSFFITSCSAKHYKELSPEKYKKIYIPKDYTAIYCSCDKNPLLLKFIQELREVGLKVIIIDDYIKLDKICQINLKRYDKAFYHPPIRSIYSRIQFLEFFPMIYL